MCSDRPTLQTVGVLGGMGPAATVDFLAKIIGATPASIDQDHIPTIVWNCPQIPDRSRAILARDDTPLAAMMRGLDVLEAAGAGVIAIPCNTAHHWFDQLATKADAPILHIADAVAARLDAAGRVGLMATRGTIAAEIYQGRLPAGRLVMPDAITQSYVDAAIEAVKAGGDGRAASEKAVARLRGAGADRVILACTELPIAMSGSHLADLCVDATQALAEACVAASRGLSNGQNCVETPSR